MIVFWGPNFRVRSHVGATAGSPELICVRVVRVLFDFVEFSYD
jgi:hypothetical protein